MAANIILLAVLAMFVGWFVYFKIQDRKEEENNKFVNIHESMSFSDFKNRMQSIKKNKNQKVKSSKVRVGDISISGIW